MSPQQRHHYNMKAGFDGDQAQLSIEPVPAVKLLYEDLPAGRRGIMSSGFENRIRELFKDPRLHCEERWFVEDDTEGEIRGIIGQVLDRR